MTKRIASIWMLIILALFGVRISAAQSAPPSGEIAFSSNRVGSEQIYLMNADGSNVRQLTHDQGNSYAPLWSPDGQKLLYVSALDSAHPEWVIIDADGSHPLRIAPQTVDTAAFCVWSPDSQWLIYPVWMGTPTTHFIRFHRVRADGMDDQLLDLSPYNTAQDSIRHLLFFPDGSLLATDLHALYSADADGSHVQPLAEPIRSPVALSPDGQQMVGVADDPLRILEIDSSGSKTLFPALTSGTREDFRVSFVESLGWSPNGDYLWGVIATLPSATQTRLADQVFIGTADGADYWLHTPTPDSVAITWSPDSQWIAYTVQSADSHDQIAISAPIGTDQAIITSAGDNFQPAWRPTVSN